MIADAVVLTALYFIDRGVKAERKLLELQEHHADQKHEMDKEAKIAQKASQRTAVNFRGKNKPPINGGHSSKVSHNHGYGKAYHIQQPSKGH
jgi:hypothetical protein